MYDRYVYQACRKSSQKKVGTLNQYNKSDDDCLERSCSRMQMQYFNDVSIGREFVLIESNVRKIATKLEIETLLLEETKRSVMGKLSTGW